MKVAVLAPTHLPARRANTVQVMKMTQAIVRLGYSARLAVPGLPAQQYTWEELALHYGLQEQFFVDWINVRPAFRGYDFGISGLRWARQRRSDLIYTRHPQVAALASQTGFPTILEIHDLPQRRFGGFLFRLFIGGRGARRLVAISHSLLNTLKQRFQFAGQPPFTLVLPDGVDLERFQELPEPAAARQILAQSGQLPDMPTNGFTAGYTGHLYPGRGAEVLVELAARAPEIQFLLAGGEPEAVEQMRLLVRQKNLTNVYLTGFIPNAELPIYQAACDVLLMPYQQRVAASSGGDIGQFLSPMKLFEYLATRRPILSSDLPVLREILNDENAVLLPPEQPQAWVSALHSLYNHPERRERLAQNAYALVQNYTWEKRARRLLEGL
jgi:glycosyltransferase involved in cell wall biosynthesis